MSTRNVVDQVMTGEMRAKVEKFIAETASEPDDLDMDEVVRQNLAGHEAALTGKQAEARPAKPKVPKPTAGFIVVNPDWDPAKHPAEAWNPHPTLKEARAQKTAFQCMVPGEPCTKVILKATTTYTFVEGGGDG